MDLSISLLIAASFAILCTYYIGDKILVIDFSAYRPQNLKSSAALPGKIAFVFTLC